MNGDKEQFYEGTISYVGKWSYIVVLKNHEQKTDQISRPSSPDLNLLFDCQRQRILNAQRCTQKEGTTWVHDLGSVGISPTEDGREREKEQEQEKKRRR